MRVQLADRLSVGSAALIESCVAVWAAPHVTHQKTRVPLNLANSRGDMEACVGARPPVLGHTALN